MFSSHPIESSIEALRVFEFKNGQPRRVQPDRAEYKVLAAAASLALDLLQSETGYGAFLATATGILRGSANNPMARRIKRVTTHTKAFMNSILKTFPYLVINDLQAMNARTTRFRWYNEEMKLFGARYAGVIEVNSVVRNPPQPMPGSQTISTNRSSC